MKIQFFCIFAQIIRKPQQLSVYFCDFQNQDLNTGACQKLIWSNLALNLCRILWDLYSFWAAPVCRRFSSIILQFSVAFSSVCRRFSVPLVGIFAGNGRKIVRSSSTVNFSWYPPQIQAKWVQTYTNKLQIVFWRSSSYLLICDLTNSSCHSPERIKSKVWFRSNKVKLINAHGFDKL